MAKSRLKNAIEWISAILGILSAKALIVSLVVGVGVAMWEAFRGLPAPSVILAGTLMMASLLVILVAVRHLILPKTAGGKNVKRVLNVVHVIDKAPLKQVSRKQFQGETVRLDGHEYIGCHFHSCTFEYLGGNYRFTSCTSEGGRGIIGSYGPVAGTIGLALALRLMIPPTTGPEHREGPEDPDTTKKQV